MKIWQVEATIIIEAETKKEAIEKLDHCLHTDTSALCCNPHSKTKNINLRDWKAEEI